MKKEYAIVGLVALAGVAYFGYYKKATGNTQVNREAITGNFKGYSNMMKLSPMYYNATSMGNVAPQVQAYSPGPLADTWSLGSNGGNGSSINPGWTNMPDSYSAEVSNAWLQCEAQAARL